ncbi:MAG: hypothetical protein ACOYJJ_09815 [Anaerovoracaceae bacterium]|jgi:hypothetical protein
MNEDRKEYYREQWIEKQEYGEDLTTQEELMSSEEIFIPSYDSLRDYLYTDGKNKPWKTDYEILCFLITSENTHDHRGDGYFMCTDKYIGNRLLISSPTTIRQSIKRLEEKDLIQTYISKKTSSRMVKLNSELIIQISRIYNKYVKPFRYLSEDDVLKMNAKEQKKLLEKINKSIEQCHSMTVGMSFNDNGYVILLHRVCQSITAIINTNNKQERINTKKETVTHLKVRDTSFSSDVPILDNTKDININRVVC